MRTIGKDTDELKNIFKNRERFLHELDLDLDDSCLVMVDYDRENYTEFHEVTSQQGGAGMAPLKTLPLDFTNRQGDAATKSAVIADALVTKEKNLGLFLPLADCLGAVIYDPTNEILCVAHLGRHATEQFAAQKVIEYLKQKFDSNPADLHIWLSPVAGGVNYPLFKFDNKSLREVNIEQFVTAGINPEHISGDDIDTTTHEQYYSHSEAQKTGDDLGKRFAIAAKMNAR
jgi:hypothetical protein